MSDEVTITAATVADVSAVVDLIGRVYAEYGFVWEARTEVPDLFAFETHYAAPRGAFFVAHAAGRTVGSVGVERVDDRGAELHRLYVEESCRGRGAGRALIERVLAWCHEQRMARLILWSDTRFKAAHRLYERMGFRRCGERELVGDVNQTREYGFEREV
jgi:GNAT superfamily N-acetyltransferase